MLEIEKLIKRGEGKTVEFKRTLSDGLNIAKTVIAFSNMAGGKIIVGVEDKTGKIIGINDDEALDFPDRVSSIIHQRCSPFILPEIYVDNIDGKKVLVIKLFPGPLKPYYLKSKGMKEGTYIRVGATNKIADREMIMELERQKRNTSFDEELDYDLDEKSLVIERLKADFREYTGKNLDFNGLLNLKILKEENGKIYPSVGGLLLAGKTDYLEYARVKCARFKGTNMDVFIDRKEFSGPLYRQVEGAMRFAHVYIALSGKVEGLQRVDRYEIPLEVIREALVNAVVHRDYSITGSDIKFAVFDDRIEITSPGALPRSLEIEDIIAGRSEIRNKVIARFFKEIDFIEQWGSGIRKIIRLLVENGLQGPDFYETGLFFKIIIYKKSKVMVTYEDDEMPLETPGPPTPAEPDEPHEKPHKKPDEKHDKKPHKKTHAQPDKKPVKKPKKSGPKNVAERDKKTHKKIGLNVDQEKIISIGESSDFEPDGPHEKHDKKPDKKIDDEPDKNTLKIRRKILKLIKENPAVSLLELARRVKLTKDAAWYHVGKLKGAGVIQRVGPRKGGRWRINE